MNPTIATYVHGLVAHQGASIFAPSEGFCSPKYTQLEKNLGHVVNTAPARGFIYSVNPYLVWIMYISRFIENINKNI